MCKKFCKSAFIFITNSNPLISLSIGTDDEIKINNIYPIGIKYFLFLSDIKVIAFLLIINQLAGSNDQPGTFFKVYTLQYEVQLF